ncbi:YpiF family protein [Paenibacillus doosanensis]|nr:YpiF family protein [Paenibacillus doosanensis]
MKFSDVEQGAWESLKPYVDTCLLPVTGMTGKEQPWEATRALEQLRDALDCFEIPYKGRVLTYPAFHYIEGEEGRELVATMCGRLKDNFPYVVLVSADGRLAELGEIRGADKTFILTPGELAENLAEIKRHIAEQLQHLWSGR